MFFCDPPGATGVDALYNFGRDDVQERLRDGDREVESGPDHVAGAATGVSAAGLGGRTAANRDRAARV